MPEWLCVKTNACVKSIFQLDSPLLITYGNMCGLDDSGSKVAANTTFTATMTTEAKDLAGNALAIDYVWTFRTK